MIDSKVFFHDIFHDTSVNFLCTYPLFYIAGMCVVTYVVVYTYLHGKCFLSALYNAVIWLASPQSKLLFVSSRDSSLRAYATSRYYAHTRHRRCFSVEGQCCKCFTSSRLSWYAVGLCLPREMPLAVTFSSCKCIMNSRTRSLRKILCVILLPHDLWIRNAFRIVMSVKWKNSLYVHFYVL
jgi:hypothetical protein